MIKFVDNNTNKTKMYPELPFFTRKDNAYFLVAKDDSGKYFQVLMDGGTMSDRFDSLDAMFANSLFANDEILYNVTIMVNA